MAGELGKARLDLEANLSTFEANVRAAKRPADDLQHSLDALAAVANVAEAALNDVKIDPRQAAESKASAEGILSGVRGISDEARLAAREIDRVRITEAQAAESNAAGDRIDSNLRRINRQANETGRALDRVRLAGGRNGAGVGPIGSGYGRIGLLGTAIGAGVLTGPAAAPAAAGLLASIPTLGAGGIGALGTLALALQGVGKAINGDKKAFDDLQPSAQQFVRLVRSLDDTFEKLRQTAGGALFPGLTTGLKAAFSPELLGTVTRAVGQLGRALGQAGAQWGRYFGSPAFTQILGPLMQAGARNIGVLSDAFLHLFDALGTLARAAIPFTNFLTTAIDRGAKLVDSWIHAKDASGQLSRALGEAEKSLRLVWNLFGSLVNVVGSLADALYPVSKVAVKDLTDGLNALAGMIDRNKEKIREIIGGALAALVSTVQALTPIVRALAKALDAVAHAIGGWKTAFELILAGTLASKFATLGARIGGVWSKLDGIGPRLARVGTASEVAAAEVGGLRGALLGLGGPEVLGAIAAAIASVKVLQALLAKESDVSTVTRGAAGAGAVGGGPLGGQVFMRDGKWYETYYTGRGAVTMQISAAQAHALQSSSSGSTTSGLGGSAGFGLLNPQAHTPTGPARQPGTATPYLDYLLAKAAGTSSLADDRNVLSRMITTLKARLAQASTLAAKTALQQAINADVAQLKAAQSSPYGGQPPFTKNTGTTGSSSASVIPAGAARAESLASANASRASALGNVGTAAKRYLEAELADLQTADKLIRTKYEAATGKARTSLFAALTSVENKMRTVRERIGKAIKDNREAELRFAVDQAKEAVAAATVGSSAYDKAVAAEEKALRALIKYEDARAKNAKLSVAARDKAVRAEETARKQLKSLLKPAAASAGANEQQFLSSFADIVSAFAPNAFPAGDHGGKIASHLYEVKHELRQQTPLLRAAIDRSLFPDSDYVITASGAVGG